MNQRRIDKLLLLGGALVLWQVLYMLTGPEIVSSPAATLSRAATLLQLESFWKDAASTGKAFAIACAISIAGGIAIGFMLGFNRFTTEVADPILGTVYSIPKITLYPIILLIFGLSLSAKVAFGVIHGVFPIIISTMSAVGNVSPIHRRTAKAMRLSRLSTVVTVLTPAALPEIFAGVRIGIAVTLLGTLLAELFASASGIGFALIRAMDLHVVVDIYALALLVFAFAATINGALHYLERKLRRHA